MQKSMEIARASEWRQQPCRWASMVCTDSNTVCQHSKSWNWDLTSRVAITLLEACQTFSSLEWKEFHVPGFKIWSGRLNQKCMAAKPHPFPYKGSANERTTAFWKRPLQDSLRKAVKQSFLQGLILFLEFGETAQHPVFLQTPDRCS